METNETENKELLAQETQEPAPEAPQTAETASSEGGVLADIVDILETMLVSVFVVLLLFTYVMRPVTVEGTSMVPTLQDSDRLLMYRMLYTPKNGDIVVVNNQQGHVLNGDQVVQSGYSLHECIIKRVIAVGGQTIDIDKEASTVTLDGVVLDEPYINEAVHTDDGAFQYPLTVPEGYVFVMGDNRNHSTDSRNDHVGLVPVEDVLGTAFFRYVAMETVETVDETTGQIRTEQKMKFDRVGFIG